MLLVDSMSPCERPVSSATSIASRWVRIRRWSCTNAGIRDRRAQLAHWSSAILPSFAFDRERVTQPFFEQVGAPQSRVGLGDPVELGALTAGEIAGVLPQRVARFGDVFARRRSSVLGVRGRDRGWRDDLWLGSRHGAVRYRALRSPTRRHGTDPRSAPRSGPGPRRRGRSSQPYPPKHGSTMRLVRGRARRRTLPGRCRCGPVPPTPAGPDHDQRRRSGNGVRACRRSHRSRSGVTHRDDPPIASMSALTCVTIDPTVRHATRNSSITALFEVRTASQAARSSKSRVWPAP